MKARTGALVARFHRPVDDETQRRGEPGGSVARARCRRLGATEPAGAGSGAHGHDGRSWLRAAEGRGSRAGGHGTKGVG